MRIVWILIEEGMGWIEYAVKDIDRGVILLEE